MYFLWASRFFVQSQSGFSCVNSTQYTLSSEVDLIVVAMTIIIIIIILIINGGMCVSKKCISVHLGPIVKNSCYEGSYSTTLSQVSKNC